MEKDDSENWIMANEFLEYDHLRLWQVSMYWAITTLTTVGYGDISGTNDIERGYASVVMIIGIMVYSYIIGSIAGLLSEFDHEQA
jgi:hypothetical protein